MTGRATFRDVLFGLLALIGAWVMGISAAGAHAGLVSTNPADGAVLDAAPSRYVLSFSEPVSPLRVSLVAPDGSRRDLSGASLSGSTLSVPAPAGAAAGTHVLSWRVVSADGHPVAGSLAFSIGAPSAMPAATTADDGSVRALIWMSRIALYAGLFFGVGGAAGLLAASGPSGRAPRLVRTVLALGLAAAPVALLGQGLDALGAPLAAFADPHVWRAGAGTSFAATLALAAISMATALLASSVAGRRTAAGLCAAALLGAGLALAASGHAANASPQWLTRPAVAVHALAVALWIGALVPLAASLGGDGLGGASALRCFSRRMPIVVAALLASGTVLAIVQVGAVAALGTTAYGRVLLAKLLLVALLLSLAALNRRRLTPSVLRGLPSAAIAMRRVILAEIGVAVLILSTAALWRFTPPPRVEAAIAAEPAVAHATGRGLMADITLSPGRAGRVSAQATLFTIDYGPVAPTSVAFVFEPAAGGIDPIRRIAENRSDGIWRAETSLPVPGTWTVKVEVLADGLPPERIKTTIDLRP
ncbi:copper resistance protein CopC [Aureimonas sp. SK2]|uniref:copper resistance CopC/CopD family protein n=1 Tax=Aureimonas sp. SK2 TaxID=3015992 RepID=UPI00244482F8|nr:copper resistance protein CopC [Aureimonas sp. SK2]